MKASLAWINQYVQPGDVSAAEAESVLTFAGMNIDAVEAVEGVVGAEGDARLEVELTSNRGDCLAHAALAREIVACSVEASMGGGSVGAVGGSAGARRFVPPGLRSAAPTIGGATGGYRLRNELMGGGSAAGCPAFMLRLVRGVKVGPSPSWLRARLEAIGQRSINNVVDATNFVLHELGQPSHVFDAGRISGELIVVRAARKGETLALLDGRTITLGGGEMIIADDHGQRPISLAGVMGGSITSVSEQTRDVLVEVATWNPLLVRMASRRHNLRTDSSHRYERYVDARTLDGAHRRLIDVIGEVAGGAPEAEAVVEALAAEVLHRTTLRASRLASVLGITLEPARVERALRAQGFGVEAGLAKDDGGPQWHVTVPAWRHDVRLEADVIEEVARTIGYGAIEPPEMLSVRVSALQRTEQARREMARVLTGLGFYETITFSFTNRKQAGLFAGAAGAGAKLVGVSDERRGDEGVCRPSVLTGLLSCRRANQDARSEGELASGYAGVAAGVRLFEVGAAFAQDERGASRERRVVGLLVDAPSHVGGASAALASVERRQAAVRLVRGAVERLVEALSGHEIEVRAEAGGAGVEALDASASGVIYDRQTGARLGVLGMLSAAGQSVYDLAQPVAVAEIEIDGLLGAFPPRSAVRELATLPSSDRDVSLVVAEGTRWSEVWSVIGECKPALLERVRFVGVYRGKPLESGRKSVTFRMTFRDATRTLRDEDITPQVEEVVSRAKERLGATLRV
jgi:phenylalanyl-tRNA synthetase beta chain